jgi:hypothetical protein
MKKVTAVLLSLVCVVSLNFAFAGGSKATDTSSPSQPTHRPRFQR